MWGGQPERSWRWSQEGLLPTDVGRSWEFEGKEGEGGPPRLGLGMTKAEARNQLEL